MLNLGTGTTLEVAQLRHVNILQKLSSVHLLPHDTLSLCMIIDNILNLQFHAMKKKSFAWQGQNIELWAGDPTLSLWMEGAQKCDYAGKGQTKKL